MAGYLYVVCYKKFSHTLQVEINLKTEIVIISENAGRQAISVPAFTRTEEGQN